MFPTKPLGNPKSTIQCLTLATSFQYLPRLVTASDRFMTVDYIKTQYLYMNTNCKVKMLALRSTVVTDMLVALSSMKNNKQRLDVKKACCQGSRAYIMFPRCWAGAG